MSIHLLIKVSWVAWGESLEQGLLISGIQDCVEIRVGQRETLFTKSIREPETLVFESYEAPCLFEIETAPNTAHG